MMRLTSFTSGEDRRVLNTCLYLGFRADLADRKEAKIL